MIKSEFSEKFFEILIDHCLLSKGFHIYVPSQYKENKLGYDALINDVKRITGRRIQGLVLQYKTAEKYIIPKYMPENCKFSLYPANNYRQHNRLYFLNTRKKSLAYYCVPEFTDIKDLYSYFNSGSLLSKSILIKPMSKLTGNKSHYYSFCATSASLHSKDRLECNATTLEHKIKEPNDEETMSTDEFINLIDDVKNDYFFNEENKQIEQSFASTSFSIAYKIIE